MPENVIPVTKWFRLKTNSQDEVIGKSFNHYAEGWVGGSYPEAFNEAFTNQVAWENEFWTKEFTYMTGDMRII